MKKPEVVASGVNIKALVDNNVDESTGTSLSAPQTAGLAALLINRNPGLFYWPEAQRAIIMASSTHNIEGPAVINHVYYPEDLQDGAGAINASEADKAASVHANFDTICNASCWWGDHITNSNFPVDTEITRSFNVTTPSIVRVAIAWWANADTPANNYSFSRLDTDLDLSIKDPSGEYVTETDSWSFDNNYEIVEFIAHQFGEYHITIYKHRADEEENYVGTALVMFPPEEIYLPLIMR